MSKECPLCGGPPGSWPLYYCPECAMKARHALAWACGQENRPYEEWKKDYDEWMAKNEEEYERQQAIVEKCE